MCSQVMQSFLGARQGEFMSQYSCKQTLQSLKKVMTLWAKLVITIASLSFLVHV